jgi:hypothetical protein
MTKCISKECEMGDIYGEVVNKDEEVLYINNGRIRNATFKYVGTEDDVDRFLKKIVIDKLIGR